MKIDRSTKVILALIAIGLFLNAADKFGVDPAEADNQDVIAENQGPKNSDYLFMNQGPKNSDYLFMSIDDRMELFRMDLDTGVTWKLYRKSRRKGHSYNYWEKVLEPEEVKHTSREFDEEITPAD